MPQSPIQNTQTLPGTTQIVDRSGAAPTASEPTALTANLPFAQVQHLLSDKPPRRPTRTKPRD